MLRITKTENGMVRGLPAADPRITVFKGIPFASPPVRELRWRAPQPAPNWKGVRACLEFMPIAMQRTPGTNPGSGAFYGKEWHVDPDVPIDEDCLYLNIWTNAKTGDEKMPVMVWIYGGGLMEGYPWEMEFDGERIARRGVILISVNYRLNVFGFMTHPEIIKSSRWIRGKLGLS
jgi:para-nitrobenzyl esterase